ncbi:MAG TPA: 5-bromo-4-chloroindolyl phosphate hydrolysis protein [Clostridiales bacterium]|nr:5-bromo-4-chloroindolyl phosphate hydrolysis protein [Clostridiales bacterium]HCI64243.1 5-bromo-4-chloroindolyl phosphate hydrolysis protein [Clostridiales bacterium]
MAYPNQDWEDIGRSIQNIIDQAINSQDYRKLNQTITRTVGRAIDAGGQAVRRAVDTAAKAADNAARSAQARPRPTVIDGRENMPALYGSTDGKTALGIAKIVGGGMLTGFGFVGALLGMIFALTLDYPAYPALMGLAGLGVGAWLIGGGIQGLGRVNRFKRYCRCLGDKTYCKLETLARTTGKNVKFVRKELEKMIDDGLFLEGHLDAEQTCLITSNDTYRQFEQSRLALEERQKQEREAAKLRPAAKETDPRVREVLDRGNAFISEIRRCNDAIPGEEISEKISYMELLVRRIFDRAQAHPEVVPDLKKLMDYYLPMTVKLLNAYAEMDAQPVQGETIQASKIEIEKTLDTLNAAFAKLLDDLFQDAAMDVSSDISVLNTLLAQEGLTNDGLSNLKKQEN